MSLLAFYDLDRTITRKPTWTAFLVFAAARRAPWRLALLPMAGLWALGHAAGFASRDRLKEVMHALLIGRSIPRSELDILSEDFAARLLSRNMRPGARERISAERAAGYRIVLATAAHRFYADAIARGLGIHDVIATEAVLSEDGYVTNRIRGENLYGLAKLAAVERWLSAEGLLDGPLHIRFYSDHASDEPCLARADEAFAVNPHARLRALARSRGWRSLNWNEVRTPVRDAGAATCSE